MNYWNKKLIFIICIATLLRLIGFFWGDINGDGANYFEPDEYQHVEIVKNLIDKYDDNVFENYKSENIRTYNTRGFGTQLALIGYPLMKASGFDARCLIYTGRVLSLIYSIILIMVVYRIAILIFKDEMSAFISAILLSIFDLNVTYSHYCLPEIPYVFWAYFSVFLALSFYSRNMNSGSGHGHSGTNYKRLLIIVLCTTSVLTMKYDFIPLLLFLLVILYLLLTGHLTINRSIIITLFIIVCSVFFFFILNGFDFSVSDIRFSFSTLYRENHNSILHDNHLLLNPVVFPMIIICGSSLPVFIVFAGRLYNLTFKAEKKAENNSFNMILFFCLFIAAEFIVLWNLDVTCNRRANIFLPFVAIIAGNGLAKLRNQAVNTFRYGKCTVYLILLYTSGITLVSQSNFIFETRSKAIRYINDNNIADKTIGYSYYAAMSGMPRGEFISNTGYDFIIIHETNYKRYWKAPTTPFRIPECCSEVFHCNDVHCRIIQSLLSGKSDYRLYKDFRTPEIFPERVIYKYLLGSYEDFTGDVLIFKKKDNNYQHENN